MKKIVKEFGLTSKEDQKDVPVGLFAEFDALPESNQPQDYLVVVDLGWSYNDSLARSETVKNPISSESFLAIVKDFVSQNDMSIEFAFDDTVILLGSESNYDEFKKMNADIFSYARCCNCHLDSVIEAHGDYMLETPEETEQRIPESSITITADFN